MAYEGVGYKPTWVPNGIRANYFATVGAPSGGDDYQMIQDSLTNNDVTTLSPGQTYTINTGLDIPEGKFLDLNGGKLQSDQDINMVRVRDGCRLMNGTIENTASASGRTDATCQVLLYADGPDQFTRSGTLLFNLYIKGGTNAEGANLLLQAVEDTGNDIAHASINSVSFIDVTLQGAKDNIRFDCEETSGETFGSWINGNNFSNISLFVSENGIRTISSGTGQPDMRANMFTNVQYQFSSATKRVINASNTFERNRFMNLSVFDWESDTVTASTGLTIDADNPSTGIHRVTMTAHGLQTGQRVDVSSATDSDLDATNVRVTVIDDDTFSYINDVTATDQTDGVVQIYNPMFQFTNDGGVPQLGNTIEGVYSHRASANGEDHVLVQDLDGYNEVKMGASWYSGGLGGTIQTETISRATWEPDTNTYGIAAPTAGGMDLVDIVGFGARGTIMTLYGTSASNVVTLKDGTGNLRLPSDLALGTTDTVQLLWTGTVWLELSRSDNT